MKLNLYSNLSYLMKRGFFVLLITISIIPTLLAQYAPGDSNAIPVFFMFTHTLAPGDSGVGLNGAFNSWTNGVFKMQQVTPGFWTTTIQVLPLGYEYKFVTYKDTAGQTGVINYYSDPLNPKISSNFNNSVINVKSPMIYYFLPMTGTTITNTRPTIRANISWANKDKLDLSKMVFTVDGSPVSNPQQYFDTTTRVLSYTPPTSFSAASHTADLLVYTTAGDSTSLTTTFTVSGSSILAAPYTFQFDSKSPNFKFLGTISNVSVKSSFNSFGADPLIDSTGSGVYSFKTNLTLGQSFEYVYVINGGLYTNDPDNPNLSINHETIATAAIDSLPRFGSLSSASGKIFNYPVSSVNISTALMQSDLKGFLDFSSVYATVDGVAASITRTFSGTQINISLSIASPSIGRHVVRFFGKDLSGRVAPPVTYVFGVYPSSSGYHYVDGDNDDVGPGTYTYPTGIDSGSADIKSIDITTTSGKDSLMFAIKMGKISKYTRVGFGIVNTLDGTYVEAPQNINLKIPEWNGRGVFAILSEPNSAYYDSSSENDLLTSSNPIQSSLKINMDSTEAANGEFKFTLPLSALQNIMGTYNKIWYFGAYSYLKNQNGAVNPGPEEAGAGYPNNPLVYDAAFFSDSQIQERLLANYSSAAQIGGPTEAVIGSNQRGYIGIMPSDIDSLLGQAPSVQIYANGGPLYYDTVSVYGYVGEPAGSTVNLNVNDSAYTSTTGSDQKFHFLVTLKEGNNNIMASAPFGSNGISSSQTIVYNYIVNHIPLVKINTSVYQNTVTMNGDSTIDPDRTALSYYWTQDAGNPAQINISNPASQSITFSAPPAKGEYYFTLKAVNSAQDTGWARSVFVVGDSAYYPNMSEWHPAWVDSAVIYCVFLRTLSSSGTINALTAQLQQLQSLGVNCIWLLPIHPTTGNLGPDNPGYAITDYYGILPQYGTKADFKNLVHTAHQYGIRVIMDYVVNHTSDLHPFMLDANKYKQYSPYYPFYEWDQNNNYEYYATWVDLPSINYEAATTREYLLRMARYWLENFNIDGFRCDVAWGVNDLRPSGPAFWQAFRSQLKAIKPDIFLLGEADASKPQYFNAKFDAAYDWNWFAQMKGIFNGTGNINQLDSTTDFYLNNNQFPPNATQFRYLENQDEQRFINQFGIADTKAAADLLLTAPGVPELYAGQEVGELTYRGNINWADPYSLRPFYTKLINIRKDNPALTKGDYLRIANTAPVKVYSYLRTSGNNDVIVNINFSSSSQTTNISVPLNKLVFDSTSSYYLNDELNQISYPVSGTALRNYQVTLPATSAQILVLSNTQLTEVKENPKNIPTSFTLYQNYPNPFNPSTVIRFALPFDSKVKLDIYNILGQRIAELINNVENAGYHEVVWNAANLASGVYIYRIEAASNSGRNIYSDVKKMVMIK
ncbi:MAG: alpha-amylase family glycosyl hydrolase [Ignavibacteriaceae bacterium]